MVWWYPYKEKVLWYPQAQSMEWFEFSLAGRSVLRLTNSKLSFILGWFPTKRKLPTWINTVSPTKTWVSFRNLAYTANTAKQEKAWWYPYIERRDGGIPIYIEGIVVSLYRESMVLSLYREGMMVSIYHIYREGMVVSLYREGMVVSLYIEKVWWYPYV